MTPKIMPKIGSQRVSKYPELTRHIKSPSKS